MQNDVFPSMTDQGTHCAVSMDKDNHVSVYDLSDTHEKNIYITLVGYYVYNTQRHSSPSQEWKNVVLSQEVSPFYIEDFVSTLMQTFENSAEHLVSFASKTTATFIAHHRP
jgi:hypothetical protein